MIVIFGRCCFVFALAPIVCNADTLAERFDDLDRLAFQKTVTFEERSRLFSRNFDDWFTGDDGVVLTELDDAELDYFFRAAMLAAFYTHQKKYAEEMVRAERVLRDRNLLTQRHRADLTQALIRARMFTRAKEYVENNSDATSEPLPEFVIPNGFDATRPGVLRVDEARRRLVTTNIELDTFDVVVVAHPLCHFSTAAVAAIDASPRLKAAFAGNVAWIAPVDGLLQFDALQEWNRQHPAYRVAPAYRVEAFDGIDTWSTPTFYFMKHGNVVGKVIGWPTEGNEAELTKQLEALARQ